MRSKYATPQYRDPFGAPASRARSVEFISEFLVWFLSFSLVCFFLLILATSEAKAEVGDARIAPASAEGLVRPGDAGSGALLLKTVHDGLYLEAPRLATDVEIDVSGPILRAKVTQRFENPSEGWVEGVYVFPLPEDAAVDALRMVIGERIIEGRIKERGEARRIYEQARDDGRRASLIEQERANIFTNSVANIGPGETVVIQIEYQDTALYGDGAFSLRFPMVVAPRYSPPPQIVQSVNFEGDGSGSGWGVNDPVPDRNRISPPVMRPNEEADAPPHSPLALTIDLRAGFPLDAIASSFHEIDIERDGREAARITLRDGAVEANRDFELVWRAAPGARPDAALFREQINGEDYFLAMITPPAGDFKDAPREAVFVIDNSGSMSGPSIRQAKASLLLALERLGPDDRFNVIRFSSDTDQVFASPQPASNANKSRAMRFVANLEAEGGTEMLPALQAALSDLRAAEAETVRQVIFLTDGAIGNETQLFDEIGARLGRSRLFTVGIGSAPNSYFMSRAARIGRGTFTHIGDLEQVESRMAELFEKLERPVLTNISAEFTRGGAAEIWPDPLPDLYAGEPLVIAVKADNARGRLALSGMLDGAQWTADLRLRNAAEGAGVSKLWARRKIAAIEESRFAGAAPEAIDAGVLETALAHNLVSRLTSLVAVDVTPARAQGAPATRRDVPLNLPEGWDFDKVFGPDARPAPAPAMLQRDARLRGATALAMLRAPETAPAEAVAEAGIALPQGALGLRGLVILGLLAWLAAFLLLTISIRIRRRKS